MDDSSIQYLVQFEWPEKVIAGELEDQHRQAMISLRNREYLLDDEQEKALLLGLIDIIFAYAYDFRTTEGDPVRHFDCFFLLFYF